MKVTIQDIQDAQLRISSVIKKTEVDLSGSASRALGADTFFKYENSQFTGSFKLRGAYNRISTLSESEKKNGVVASSAGNHAQGVAFSAQKAGVKATIVMPENAPLTKIAATKGYGAEVVLYGELYDDAYEHARKLEKEKQLTFVHPYQDEKIIAGQGTIGLELLQQIPDLDTIIVPVGGGGLISGIATAIKAMNPNCRVIGVQSDQAPGMSQMFSQKSSILPTLPKRRISTIADGIAIKTPSAEMYESFISKLVDDVVTVSDDEIAEALVFLLERAKTVCEGSGAASFAAALAKKIKLGKRNCMLLSGGNIDLNIVAKIIEKGQIRRGRIVELSVIVDDTPGTLHRLTKTISEARANILQVHHDRISQGLFLRETRIDFVLETTSLEHVQEIKNALMQMGIKIIE